MDRSKRRSSFRQFSNEATKKLRTTADEEKLRSNSITSLENLSNEIFYEIFDYMDGGDIYLAFSNLNIRLQRIITCPSLLLKLSLNEKSPLEIRHCCKEIVIPNREHLFSLKLRDFQVIDKFFSECVIDSSFTRFESINLVEISAIKLMTILIYLKLLPRLLSLRIDLEHGDSDHFNEIYQMIFRLPFLKHNKLSVLTQGKLNIFIPVPANEQFSTIEYLVLSHMCDLNELASILRHTPRLRHLVCQSLIESEDYLENQISTPLVNLTHVGIDDCRVKFDGFEKFIKKISSQLQVLRIDSFQTMNFISPERWERLISQHMPNLLRFTLKFHMFLKYYVKEVLSHVFINQFNSQFWFERRWDFRFEIKPEKIFYIISPNKNSSRQNTDNSSSPIELSIANHSAIYWGHSFMTILCPLFLTIQFTSLHLFWSGLSFCTLIELLNLLPNLHSLKVSSSLLLHMKRSSIKNMHNLRNNSKITKLWQWMDFDQVRFLSILCPRMEHCEVNGVKDTDLQKLLRYISTAMVTHILHLHSLRLNVYNANDMMVYKLQNIIDSEKLLSNYTIQRLDNTISLQWK